MRAFFEAVLRLADRDPDRVAFADSHGTLTRAGLLGEAARLSTRLPKAARTIGLLLPNGREWAVAQLACVASGRIAVPLPTFFSVEQIRHIVRDAAVDLVLTTEACRTSTPPGLPVLSVALTSENGTVPGFHPGFGTLIYTSGSTGRPKGVRHESGQIGWSTAALAEASAATEDDSYLSVLPLSLLLESICAIFVPSLVGGRCHFDTALAEAVGRAAPTGLAAAFARHRPTTGVLVPELLRLWVAELLATGESAPTGLRFVAVGGAAVPPHLAESAWRLGIPIHEGYGLSECCSVVAMNRPGARIAGTVGEPLPGLAVTIRNGEIHVDGPCVTDGYLGGSVAERPWATGDLGALDETGRLTVFGRKDNLVVTALGRNVSPEWVESAILDDPGIAFCAAAAAGAGLAALVVPTPRAAAWFDEATPEAIDERVAMWCAALPAYARPMRIDVLDLARAKAVGLFTDNGRIRRSVARELIAGATGVFPQQPIQLEERAEP
ncbi:AMP-binding protein [Pinisolibacter sp. B13]|uniref:AMP-binding protein n=1 Tax=Pinisolibacter aquiterrae TaxID=2815579 RepID=UPI001C3CFA60|nr:AMP-binding protein [Pinisolibacter aquiterrae]MBV5266043.1 AMP-binding protein [Pinisolibacter aquiterrae]